MTATTADDSPSRLFADQQASVAQRTGSGCEAPTAGIANVPAHDKRAIVAVAHGMIVSIYHMLSTDTPYQDLGPDLFSNRISHETRRRRLLTQLDALGYEVTLTPRTEAASGAF
ncbi:hypothetical protein J2Z21_009388 [Streptomyces griseochromogenes]|uniref:Transposase n=2 Tax=Streptomyces griseochromogenes TaxID=68214 RepID=A0A1B1AZD3_9ACTN|nr:hypothetical protein AVL59_22080 [Streptomyces griseochromogenes]MBP2056370.1 hypothetical protein [Streptomyces griseochromogenes]